MKNNYCKIYVVRHGQTEANRDKIVAGHFNTPLTKDGEQQALVRGEELKDITFDKVFSSDLVRAQRTAELIVLEKKLAVETKEIIRERFFGKWEGQKEDHFKNTTQELHELKKTLSEEQKMHFKFDPEMESDNDVAMRMFPFLREVAIAYLGKTVLVVAHGSIMRATLMHLGFGASDELPAGCIENTGYFVLESDGVDFFIKETKGIHKKELSKS